jgi:hypothetical protein
VLQLQPPDGPRDEALQQEAEGLWPHGFPTVLQGYVEVGMRGRCRSGGGSHGMLRSAIHPGSALA